MTDKEAKAWKKMAVRLSRCLSRFGAWNCGNLTHSNKDYHKWDEPCPVEAEIQKTIDDYNKQND